MDLSDAKSSQHPYYKLKYCYKDVMSLSCLVSLIVGEGVLQGPIYSEDVSWSRVSSLGTSGSEAETLPPGHCDLCKLKMERSYPTAALYQDQDRSSQDHAMKSREHMYNDVIPEGDLILQALSGFLLILTCDGEVFYTSHTVETYLGFHQSDICHQSVYELVHSEDREELQRHIMWNSQLPSDRSALSLQEALLPENSHLLERNFTVRFRCLLDNTSGFLRLDIRGRIKILHGQNHKTEEPPLALFAVCTPFGPPSLLEMPHKETMFKSKHKLDLSLVSLDQRAKQVLGYSDSELADKGCYDLVHYDDLAYVASAHQELLKTGASGLIAYRLASKSGSWQWLQTSARLVYKNSKPDFILSTHRPLMEEEGRDLLGKRTMDFKVTYLDGGLSSTTDRSSLLSDSDFVLRCQRTRRYKSQIRDIISTCRKRKSPVNGPVTAATIVGGAEPATYMDDTAVVAAGYNNVYPYGTTDTMNGISAPYASAATMPQNLFTAAIDNTRFISAENFLHYRPIGTYYPDYAVTQYPSNGFLDASAARTCFTAGAFQPDPIITTKEDKLYQCQIEAAKFGDSSSSPQQIKTPTTSTCCDTTSYLSMNGVDPLRGCLVNSGNAPVQPPLLLDNHDIKVRDLGCSGNLGFPLATSSDCINSGLGSNKTVKSPLNGGTANSILMSIRDLPHWHKDEKSTPFDSRQSVLMWNNTGIRDSLSVECPATSSVTLPTYDLKLPRYCDPAGGKDMEVGNVNGSPCKWSGHAAAPKSASPHNSTSPASGKVAPQVTYSSTPYTQDMRLELPLVRSDIIRPSSVKQEGNPLLSISEVTNTLLDHH
ncbi:Aryl hydrocarbon receptor [Araneus ventricosus]|uniref:Aryl hydrocarbon receptor n=1 Tax=Araneus ventricosus TaxID=182803 RepID=A0A4Y2DRS4_ARAVE|nr:Aryl hydrocarbon receptor [Araneus ventricosus]